jgi:hypothetical protein
VEGSAVEGKFGWDLGVREPLGVVNAFVSERVDLVDVHVRRGPYAEGSPVRSFARAGAAYGETSRVPGLPGPR